MTTIIDPLGTPVPVYNRSGTAIVELTAAWTNPRTTVQIPSIAQTTIVWVDATSPGSGNEPWLELPTSAEIGDVVEVYVKFPSSGQASVSVVAATGDVLGGNTQASPGNGGSRIRKVGPHDWYKSSN